MKKYVFIVLILGEMISALSCKKDEETPAPAPSIPKLQTQVFYTDNKVTEFYSFEYDAAGRLSKWLFSDGHYLTFEYASGSVTEYIYNSDNSLQSTASFILNEKGLVVSQSDSWKSPARPHSMGSGDHLKGSETGQSTITYEYNSGGYMIKSIYVSGSYTYTETFVITNGNRFSQIFSENYNGEVNTTTYTFDYYYDKTNTIDLENMGITYFGKSNKNLIKKIMEISPNYDTLSYFYEFDAKNRVIKKQGKSPANYVTFSYLE